MRAAAGPCVCLCVEQKKPQKAAKKVEPAGAGGRRVAPDVKGAFARNRSPRPGPATFFRRSACPHREHTSVFPSWSCFVLLRAVES